MKKLLMVLMAFCGWFALIAQFYLNIQSGKVSSLGELIIRYFSYFTLLSNILVALVVTFPLVSQKSKATDFLTRPSTLTAICMYILVVGVVYNTILAALWNPTGLQKWVDVFLHTLIPTLYLVFWTVYVPKRALTWSQIPLWLVFPFTYAVFILVRGSFSGFYPYPFLDVSLLGYARALANVGVLIIFFGLLSILMVSVGHWNRKFGSWSDPIR